MRLVSSLLVMTSLTAAAAPAGEIPAFARRYRTSCSTCHTAAPKLNVMGEAFRLNGYRFPENDQLLRKEPSVPLGEDPWKDLWPRAIWPGELPGSVPIAIRLQTDLAVQRDSGGTIVDLRFPNEVYVLAAASLGEQISTFLESEWSREDGFEVVQAKVTIQDPLPWLPRRLVNVWVGLQRLYAFAFAETEIDRGGYQPFEWQRFRVSDLTLATPTGPLQSGNAFALDQAQPTLELNGLVRGRVSYAVGVAQGAGDAAEDNNRRKDLYWRLRYKIAGLALDGTYGPGRGPVLGSGGQLLDRSFTVEHFGYLGEEPTDGGRRDAHRHFGFSGRALLGRLDAGVGYVWGSHRDPWGLGTGELRRRSVFGKAEYLAYPWLIGSIKAERLTIEPAPGAVPVGYTLDPIATTRVLPGVIALVRQNVRAVAEAELFPDYAPLAPGEPRPRRLWVRLDVAF